MQDIDQYHFKRAFDEKSAATYIDMSRSFLRQGRMYGQREGKIPPPKFLKAGKRKIIYLREDLDGWLEQFQKAEHLAQLKNN